MAEVRARAGLGKVTQKELNEKFDGLKTLLQNIKSAKGVDLYTHLQNVFKTLILHYPDNALEKLEEVSYLLKHSGSHELEQFLKVSDIRNYRDVCVEMEGYIKKMKDRFGKKKAAGDDDDGAGADDETAEPVGAVPDLLEDAQVYQWAGIGFGQQELYRLQKSLKGLAAQTQATSLRFWGMIKGTDNDYYVAEGDVAEDGGDEANPPPADQEAVGTGVNKFTYFVSHSSCANWRKLPHLSPKDLKESRAVKVLFTGNLDRTIFTNPYFFGKEEHYLRAQISRISHSTDLCPGGIFRTKEDNKRDIEDNLPEDGAETVVMPSTNDMNAIGNWVHAREGILNNCRTAHSEPDMEGIEEELEVVMARMEKSDPFDERLKAVTTDKQVVVSKNQKINPWVCRMMGDPAEYKTETGKVVSNGVIVVRSLQWPGSFNFYYQGKYMNVYVGNGHKYEEVSYFPVQPPKVLDDPEEYAIQSEPNPDKEAEVVKEEVEKVEGEEDEDD